MAALPLAFGCLLLLSPSVMAEQKSPLNATDEKFLRSVGAAGMDTVKIAELGARKAQREDVKDFASLIVTEHTKINTDLKLLANGKNVDVSVVTDPKHLETYKALERASGAEFDRAFLAEFAKEHQQRMISFEEASKSVKDSDLKYWVDKTLPVLKAHQAKIHELNTSVTAKVAAGPNPGRNAGEPDGRALTPMDQGSSKYDTETTAKIRREIMASESISITAQNVKIITSNGRVTLRGAVNTVEEKRLVGEFAARHVSPTHVDNYLQVMPAGKP